LRCGAPKELLPIGPFRAPTFAKLARTQEAATFAGTQTVVSTGGDPAVGNGLDPVLGGGDGQTARPSNGTFTLTVSNLKARLPAR
jgi:hypothetical protein